MIRFSKVVLLASFLFLTVTSLSAAKAVVEEKASTFVLCKNKKDVRTLRILPESDKPEHCRITYSKGSVEQTMGANRSLNSCKSILKSIQGNLEAANWSCRSVQTAHVTTGSQVVNQ